MSKERMSKGISSNALPTDISNNGAYRQATSQTNPTRPAPAAYSFHGRKSNLKMAKFFLFNGKTAFM